MALVFINNNLNANGLNYPIKKHGVAKWIIKEKELHDVSKKTDFHFRGR
jgi:hypothetical protein